MTSKPKEIHMAGDEAGQNSRPFGGLAILAGILFVTGAVAAGLWAYRDQVTPGGTLEETLAVLEDPSAQPKRRKPKRETVAEETAAGELGADAQVAAGAEPPPAAVPASTGLYPPEATAEAAAHLCFFSFNNPVEYQQFKRFIASIQPNTPIKLSVAEYIANDADVEDAFLAVLNSGVKCDGVVLSGHHTDEFYGDRSSGDMDFDFLEEQACNPRHAAWFSHVKALWLQGCNTVKTKMLNDEVDSDERIHGSPLPMMTGLIRVNDLEDGLEDARDLLEENLNDENLVNDYMRIFPTATVFGWSFMAPGEKAGSHYSMPYHVAQVSHVLNPAEEFFANPMKSEIPAASAQHYAAALYGMLTRPATAGADPIPGMNEDSFILGWRRHGDFRFKWALDNPDLRGYHSLLNADNEINRQLKGLNCLLQAIDDKRVNGESVASVADYALAQESLIPFTSYTLAALARNSGGSLRARMQDNATLMGYLQRAAAAEGYRGNDARSLLAYLRPADADQAVGSAAVSEDVSTAANAPAEVPAQPASADEAEPPPVDDASVPAAESASEPEQAAPAPVVRPPAANEVRAPPREATRSAKRKRVTLAPVLGSEDAVSYDED
ncbi:MAG: hypothetical protein ACRETN_14310 [Nevskiales bacterium]